MKMICQVVLAGSMLLYGAASFAAVSTCKMNQDFKLAIPNTLKGRSAQEIEALKSNLEKECNLELRFKMLKNDAAKMGVDINYIAIYRALRYIQMEDYIWVGKEENVPVEKIYQNDHRYLERSVERRKTEVWENFDKGIANLGNYTQRMSSGYRITLDDLKDVQRKFYQVTLEIGDGRSDPELGRIKDEIDHETEDEWWKIKHSDEAEAASKIAKSINGQMAKHQLLPPTKIKDSEGNYINHLLFIHGKKVYSSDTRLLKEHFALWLNFFNDYTHAYRSSFSSNDLKANYPLLSPMQFAAFVQKWYVLLHGFFEGNGRTSRFWQDAALELTSLPYAASGSLMQDDVLSTHADYYNLMYDKTSDLLKKIEQCVVIVYPDYLKSRGRLPIGHDNSLPYDCKIMKKN